MTEPIETLKQQLAHTQRLCDDLQIHIAQSDQKNAAEKMQEIEQNLNRFLSSLHDEFGWLRISTEQ